MRTMLKVSTTFLLGALTVISLGGATRMPIALHTVCYDSEGAIDISNKNNYRISSNKFRNPTNNAKLESIKQSRNTRQRPYWQMEFDMPATVTRITLTGHNETEFSGIKIQLLNKAGKSLLQLTTEKTRMRFNRRFSSIKNSYIVRVKKVNGGTLSLADIKVYGTQAPAGTDCAANVRRLASGCYSFHMRGINTVEYSCKKGFRFEGRMPVLSCSLKPEDKLKCRSLPLICSAPPTILHSLRSVEQRRYYEAETVRYECQLGYYLDGPNKVICNSTGKWTPNQTPRCLRTSCSPPPSVLNGRFVGNSYYAGDQIALVCNAGYYIPGGRNRFRCSYANVWNERSHMNCFAVSCGRPTSIKDGSFFGGSFHFQDKVVYSCNSGYNIRGSNSTTCLANGTWSGHAPTCEASTSTISISSEAQKLINVFQDSFYGKYATFTEEARPPPGSASRTASPLDNVLALDLIFALDTSGSVSKSYFDDVKTFVRNMVDAFRYEGGGTNTTAALMKAIDMFSSSQRRNDRLKRVLILITDGKSNSNSRQPESVVPELARLSIERFVFGVGRIYEPELIAIASPPSDRHVFNVSSFHIFQQFAEFITPKKVESLCGVAGAPGYHSRVLNGQYSGYGAWPWLASVYVMKPFARNFSLECGGTLLNKRWIISAAHCVYRVYSNLASIRVRLGDYFRNGRDPYEQTYEVEKIKLGGNSSQRYNFHTKDNDIVLIKLSRDVNYTKYVRPICLLHPGDHNSSMILPGKRATVVGWGYFRENSKIAADSPLEATIHVIDKLTCSRYFNTSANVTSNMLCAKGFGTDACPGDSGGPLMCQSEDNNLFTLCGVVSFGKHETCHSTGYGVYTKVFNYINTIISETRLP